MPANILHWGLDGITARRVPTREIEHSHHGNDTSAVYILDGRAEHPTDGFARLLRTSPVEYTAAKEFMDPTAAGLAPPRGHPAPHPRLA